MSGYDNLNAPLDYSKYGKVSDNFENLRKNNPHVNPKYNQAESNMIRERIAAQSRSPIRKLMADQNQRKLYSPQPIQKNNVITINGDNRLNGLKFYDDSIPVKQIFPQQGNNLYPTREEKPVRNRVIISSKYSNQKYPKNPIEDDKKNSNYKIRYNDLNYLSSRSSKLQSPQGSLRNSQSRARQGSRNGRASLTMKEALENNELTKHDVPNFRMYESPRASNFRKRSPRGSVSSNDSRIKYPNDPRLEENNFSNFHSGSRRDRYIQEYPVVGSSDGFSTRENRMNQMRRHIELERNEPTLCGTGDQACILI